MKNDVRKFWVIMKEIYKKNVKSWGFVFMLLSPIVMAVFPILIGYFAADTGEDDLTIGVIAEEAFIQEAFSSEELPWERQEETSTEEEAEAAILEEAIEAYIVIEIEESGVEAHAVQVDDALQSYLPVVDELLSSVQTQLRSEQMDLGAEEVTLLLEPVHTTAESIQVDDGEIVEGSAIESVVQILFIAILAFVLFIFLTLYSNTIVQEIAAEKGTRIMEIILSTTSATTHFFGKLAGILAVLATQFLVYIVLSVIGIPRLEGLAFMEDMLEGESLVEIIQPTLLYTLGFFAIGLVIYIIFSAFLGSLANKVEDAGKMVAPIQGLTFVGFYGAFYMIDGAESTLTSVLSYVPFFSPFMMPMRIVHEQVTPTVALLSFVGCIVFAVVLLLVSLYFYRSNVLVYADTSFLGTLKRSWSIAQSNR